jgi:hypothetical protein
MLSLRRSRARAGPACGYHESDHGAYLHADVCSPATTNARKRIARQVARHDRALPSPDAAKGLYAPI